MSVPLLCAACDFGIGKSLERCCSQLLACGNGLPHRMYALRWILEEVIFRGFLFKTIAKDNIKSAVIISSVSFGIGHIINLFNGSGMDLVDNLCQIVFAIAVGFLLVTVFYRGGNLLPCILVHSVINTLGTFANDTNLTTAMHLLHLAVLIAVTVAYTLILTRTLPKVQQAKRN